MNLVAIGVAVITIGGCGIVLICPDSDIAKIIERFQTLFTGSVAGLAALITAGIIYRAAKEPIEAERQKQALHNAAMRVAGAATLYNVIQAIELTILSEAGKSPNKRLGKLFVPDALPDLNVTQTQDVLTVSQLSSFFTLAGIIDAHNVVGTWPYDPQKSHPDEEQLLDRFSKERKELSAHLKNVIERTSQTRA